MINAYYFYRISRWFYLKHIPVIPDIIKLFIFLIYNSSITHKCEIGKNCQFLYGGIGTIIAKKVKIGRNVKIGSNVVIGGRSMQGVMPVIGNNVYIATGAKILGNVTIADNVIIGANAVVIKDVPSNCSVGGVPAKILKKDIDISEFCSI
ncbi:MAG: serine acetyltransferase [Bacteroidales bacterium]|nr:serine acetyltransferase [Bacteroidales bacterium]